MLLFNKACNIASSQRNSFTATRYRALQEYKYPVKLCLQRKICPKFTLLNVAPYKKFSTILRRLYLVNPPVCNLISIEIPLFFKGLSGLLGNISGQTAS